MKLTLDNERAYKCILEPSTGHSGGLGPTAPLPVCTTEHCGLARAPDVPDLSPTTRPRWRKNGRDARAFLRLVSKEFNADCVYECWYTRPAPTLPGFDVTDYYLLYTAAVYT